ncbi:hypothetical protein, partial [Chromohalobacter sp. HP20-39]|uniref:hypothetical protein n=1 Tax=Chromohalobacter sp. HP20-39 TaxID=3079306 RepID=UPI00294B6613
LTGNTLEPAADLLQRLLYAAVHGHLAGGLGIAHHQQDDGLLVVGLQVSQDDLSFPEVFSPPYRQVQIRLFRDGTLTTPTTAPRPAAT